jgi:hypothetical protein
MILRLVRVDNGLSTTSGNTDSFFFSDESFGRDKFLLERRLSQQGAKGSEPSNSTLVGSVLGEESFVGSHGQHVLLVGEKSRIFAGGGHVNEPLLSEEDQRS